jgi:hypothetical protein
MSLKAAPALFQSLGWTGTARRATLAGSPRRARGRTSRRTRGSRGAGWTRGTSWARSTGGTWSTDGSRGARLAGKTSRPRRSRGPRRHGGHAGGPVLFHDVRRPVPGEVADQQQRQHPDQQQGQRAPGGTTIIAIDERHSVALPSGSAVSFAPPLGHSSPKEGLLPPREAFVCFPLSSPGRGPFRSSRTTTSLSRRRSRKRA